MTDVFYHTVSLLDIKFFLRQVLPHADGSDEPDRRHSPPGGATCPHDAPDLVDHARPHVADGGDTRCAAEGMYRHQDDAAVPAAVEARRPPVVLRTPRQGTCVAVVHSSTSPPTSSDVYNASTHGDGVYFTTAAGSISCCLVLGCYLQSGHVIVMLSIDVSSGKAWFSSRRGYFKIC